MLMMATTVIFLVMMLGTMAMFVAVSISTTMVSPTPSPPPRWRPHDDTIDEGCNRDDDKDCNLPPSPNGEGDGDRGFFPLLYSPPIPWNQMLPMVNTVTLSMMLVAMVAMMAAIISTLMMFHTPPPPDSACSTRSTANELRRLGDQSRRTGWIRSRITS
jgi:hypothetical protein